jgi:hypothetical protein
MPRRFYVRARRDFIPTPHYEPDEEIDGLKREGHGLSIKIPWGSDPDI